MQKNCLDPCPQCPFLLPSTLISCMSPIPSHPILSILQNVPQKPSRESCLYRRSTAPRHERVVKTVSTKSAAHGRIHNLSRRTEVIASTGFTDESTMSAYEMCTSPTSTTRLWTTVSTTLFPSFLIRLIKPQMPVVCEGSGQVVLIETGSFSTLSLMLPSVFPFPPLPPLPPFLHSLAFLFGSFPTLALTLTPLPSVTYLFRSVGGDGPAGRLCARI